ncbi:MAG: hypothetical protein HPPSJP_5350 [Candidatus Hepatoplasma scabrum]|nr:MAG: hypothetical protein HPPSJP_5350 [Candidatus Hepatoplasma sp.]
MKNLNILINELNLLSSIGPKQAQRLAIEFIKDKEENLKKLTKIINLLDNINFCNLCKTFYEGKECINCKLSNDFIYIVENLNDYFKIYDLYQNQTIKIFNLNFNHKSDYLNNNNLNNVILRLKDFLHQNEKILKISFLTPPSIESEIIIRVFKKELQEGFKERKFLFSKIKLGVPKDLNISYLNEDTMKYVFENQEEI